MEADLADVLQESAARVTYQQPIQVPLREANTPGDVVEPQVGVRVLAPHDVHRRGNPRISHDRITSRLADRAQRTSICAHARGMVGCANEHRQARRNFAGVRRLLEG
jgi:hypothetical protein